jgi:hypothetical protein
MPIILSLGPIECPFFDKILRKRGHVIPMFKRLKVVFKIFKKYEGMSLSNKSFIITFLQEYL